MSMRAVSIFHTIAGFFFILLTLNFLMCPIVHAAESSKETLAKVGERHITLQDLQATMGDSERWKEAGEERRMEVLKELVRIEVFAREARVLGLEQDEKLKREIDEVINFYLAKEYTKRNVQDVVKVTKEQVREYYQKNPEQFQNPEKMRVKQIFLYAGPESPSQEDQKMRDLAEDLLGRIQAGEDFSKLSSEFSSDPLLAQQRGDLGHIARGALAPSYQEAVFALKVGEVSPVIRGESGYSIFKNEGVTPTSLQPFDEVRETIEKRLREEMEDKLFLELEGRLIDKYHVEMWPEKLKD